METDIGFRAALARPLRPVVMALVLVDELTNELYRFTNPQWGISGLDLVQSWTMLLLTAAVLWQRRRIVMVVGAASLVLAVVAGSANGLESELILVASCVARFTLRRREVLLAHAALQLLVVLATLGLPAADARARLLVWALFSALQLVSAGLAWVAERQLRRREELARQARDYLAETAGMRSREMAGLADEMEQAITQGLVQLRNLAAAPGPDAALPRVREEIAAANHRVLANLRALVHGLRRSAARELPGQDTAARARSWTDTVTGWAEGTTGRSVALAAVLVCFALHVIAPKPSLDPLYHWWPVVAMVVAGLWPGLAPVAAVLFGLTLQRVDAAHPLTIPDVAPLVQQCLVAGLVAFGLRTLLLSRRRASDALAAAQQARLVEAARDRQLVAREVHDVVGHQLSVTSMRLMEASMLDDPRAEREAIAAISTVADAAQRDLQVLLASMRDRRSTWLVSGPLVRPSLAVRQNVAVLEQAGHPVDLVLEADIDQASDPVQRTVTRILQESTTNILRHAEPGSPVRFAVTSQPSGACRVLVVNQPRSTRGEHAHSQGWGLRGIEERMSLLGAGFQAGPQHDLWVLDAEFPAPDLGTTDLATPL